MLKVVCITDKVGTAIDRLAQGVKRYHSNLDYVVVDVHPKRPSAEQLDNFKQAIDGADVIDYQYFRTADMLREKYPEVKKIPSILTHNNPYSIKERDWADYDMVVANNMSMREDLLEITPAPVEYVPLCVDAYFWEYRREFKPNNRVIMVANRIESKKGILPVAQACKDLGLTLVLVGAISDGDYFHEVMQTGVVEFHEQIPDEQLRDLYHSCTIHVCNSVDNFESGTLPVLEAMLCGVPVVSRLVGHVPELNNGENMIIHEGEPEAIKETLSEAIKSDLSGLISKAWNTAKNRNHERRAYEYQRLYRKVLHPETTSVSVIVPIYDKPEVVSECLKAIENQTYKNLELIICNDNPEIESKMLNIIKLTQQFAPFPVRFINRPTSGYGLAKQRNLGVIEATGEVLVFCDQRVVMDKDAVEQFVLNVKPKFWLHGNKGSKKDFVENFSCVYRQELADIGLFSERMTKYGGMSQEIRTRAKRCGFRTLFCESAKATHVGKSSNKHSKKKEIIAMKNLLWKLRLEE